MTLNKCFTLLSVLFFVFTSILSAQDINLDASDKYKEVKRLIEILDYNQAINLLVDIVKQNPEEMEKAQNMIQDIREKKEEFNKKYEELIAVLFEENDYEKGLKIIDELEDLDKNPNPATEGTLRDARISAELIYFRLLFNELMDRAYQPLINGDYDEAVRIYLGGFNFHKRTYNERNYGDLIKGPVDKHLEELMNASNAFLSDYQKMKFQSADQVINQSAESDTVLDTTKDLFLSYADMRNSIWKAGWIFRTQNELLAEISSEYKEDFFLSFAWRIVYGRTTVEQDEGLIVAMDTLWSGELASILARLDQNLKVSMDKAELAYGNRDWPTARESYDEAEYWAKQSVDYYRLWSEILNLDSGTNLNEKSLALLDRYYNKQVDAAFRYHQARLFGLLSEFNQRLGSYSVYNENDIVLMGTRRDILDEEIANLEPHSEEWTARETSIREDQAYSDTLSPQLVSRSLQGLREVQDAYKTLKGQLSLNMAGFILQPYEREYERLLSEQERALAYLEGIAETEENEELNILYVYPQRTLALLEQLMEENTLLQSETSLFLEEYKSVLDLIPQKNAIEAYLLRGENLVSELETATQDYERLNSQADQNVSYAERYHNEAEYHYNQSVDALETRDFPQAVQALTSAQDLYVQALSYDEEIDSRIDIDRKIQELQARILQEENKEVILYVRENVNEGKRLYLQGRYAQSEIVLLRAESRWFTTNTEPNSEINYWMNLVRAALSVESGRTIEDTEPLYVEMTQLLNLASDNFNTGKNMIEAGNVTDGLKYLDRADQNLYQILIPMPLNQAASVLRLRIQQLRDPDLFNVVFAERYNSAVSKLKTEADEAYIDLKDLVEIEPDYPGISRAIYNAEIILGIRVPPPDTRALRESEDLYSKAFVIVEGNVRSQFPVALAQLDKAIELNPENSKAIELKDRIQLDAGGQTTIVLSSAAQSQFKNAEEKYINGEYFEAYAIVQQLLKNKDSASYPPLQDLKRRIESKF